jgi:hypothetical protein
MLSATKRVSDLVGGVVVGELALVFGATSPTRLKAARHDVPYILSDSVFDFHGVLLLFE